MFEARWNSCERSRPLSYGEAFDWEVLCHCCRGRHLASGVAMCMALRRPVVNGHQNGSVSSIVTPGKLLADFSALWEFLTGNTWPDGKPRVPGSLSLRLGQNGLQGTLSEVSPPCYLTRTGETVDDVLLALEVALGEDEPGWRASSFDKTKKR